MNGVHDMGGMQCFGPVEPETDEPVFHAEWEKRALALTVAMGATGMWNLDMSRHARESLPPAQYLSSSYYEIWIAALEKLMARQGMVARIELDNGKMTVAPVSVKRVPDGQEMAAILASGGPVEREASSQSRFRAGDWVRARNIHPRGHTRLPRYVRGRLGWVERVVGCHVFPDSHAHGGGEDPQWLYTVRFEAKELFGQAQNACVMVDCWEPYLEWA